MKTSGQPRKWEQAVLAALRAGESLAGAARVAGIHRTTVNAHAARDARFAAELDFARSAPRKKTAAAPPPRKIANKLELFLTRLAETSNVSAAADEAELTTATVYARRRTDPDFARRWYAALAEGYDNLEMELLAHLRSGETAETARRKFDVATALRCLTAHRESVAREKGRRTLADEVATIAAINARIDMMRLRAREGEKAIRTARKDAAKRAVDDGQG
jgi:hypothetical protein